jgi:hypothetical protein
VDSRGGNSPRALLHLVKAFARTHIRADHRITRAGVVKSSCRGEDEVGGTGRSTAANCEAQVIEVLVYAIFGHCPTDKRLGTIWRTKNGFGISLIWTADGAKTGSRPLTRLLLQQPAGFPARKLQCLRHRCDGLSSPDHDYVRLPHVHPAVFYLAGITRYSRLRSTVILGTAGKSARNQNCSNKPNPAQCRKRPRTPTATRRWSGLWVP